MSGAVQITVNSEPKEFIKPPTVSELLSALGIEMAVHRDIAIAVNDEVVPRGRWSEFKLAHGSSVLIITATQGG